MSRFHNQALSLTSSQYLEQANPLLSKIWMPLDAFTAETMQGLLRGDREICPLNQVTYDRFEKEKIEAIEAIKEHIAMMSIVQKNHKN